MRILVSGGAGYIGSHTAKELARAGYEPVVLDNLRNGHRWAVRWGPMVEMDLADREGLVGVFRRYEIGAVVHFAALAYVGESLLSPAEYFRNNVVNTLNLLDTMRGCGVNQIVFSSTCATYGNPEHLPIRENHPQRPVNPYGESKLMVERMLDWYGQAYGLAWTALRYFNAAGADPDGELGEVHDPETHIIPRAIAAALGDIPELEVFGTDYETPDGTAVRDYVHVTDLAQAHVNALERLARGAGNIALNLGTGRGHSVREVIGMVEEFGRRKVPVRNCPRRAGDPPTLVADASRAASELGWIPRHSSLPTVIETAWRWYSCFRANSDQFRGRVT
ncbi:MAG TPA: UDP-glucose 4-epimerase GalE [Gemmataceae bacterium]|nr:UDP-glucose 4-epimerase GalE [Gemmataceae bacterium]